MRISIALLFSFPTPLQCQFTLAHSFPASFCSMHGTAVDISPFSFIVLAEIPHFFVSSCLMISFKGRFRRSVRACGIKRPHKVKTRHTHQLGQLRCCSHINHQIRPQSTVQLIPRRTEMPAGVRRTSFPSKIQTLSPSSSIMLCCQYHLTTLQYHHVQNRAFSLLLLGFFWRGQVSLSSIATVHRPFSTSCYQHLQNIQSLFLLLATFQDGCHYLQCKAHPVHGRAGSAQCQSKIRTQGVNEFPCTAHYFETFVCAFFLHLELSKQCWLQEPQHLCSQQHELHALIKNTTASNIYISTSVPQLNCQDFPLSSCHKQLSTCDTKKQA